MSKKHVTDFAGPYVRRYISGFLGQAWLPCKEIYLGFNAGVLVGKYILAEPLHDVYSSRDCLLSWGARGFARHGYNAHLMPFLACKSCMSCITRFCLCAGARVGHHHHHSAAKAFETLDAQPNMQLQCQHEAIQRRGRDCLKALTCYEVLQNRGNSLEVVIEIFTRSRA